MICFLVKRPDPVKDACDSAEKMILFNNVNIEMNNIGGVLEINDRLKCAEECLKTKNCKAFTWAPTGHPAKGCQLKTSQGSWNWYFYLIKVNYLWNNNFRNPWKVQQLELLKIHTVEFLVFAAMEIQRKISCLITDTFMVK